MPRAPAAPAQRPTDALTSSDCPTPPPDDLAASGRLVWEAVTAEYDCEAHELALLHELGRSLDLLDTLAAVLAAEGVMQDFPQDRRVHPAAGEARQQRIVAARLSAALRLPAGDEDAATAVRRPQRRQVRGVQIIGGQR